MTDSCYPMEMGCPCPSNMQACFSPSMPGMPPMPPMCHPMDMPCPVHCDSTQIMCYDEATMTDSCYPMESGCPCPSSMQTCPSPPTSGTNMPAGPPMCHPMDMPCPVHCDYATQVMCWDEATMTDSCYPMEMGCPCPSNMQACFSPSMPGMPPMPPMCHPMDMPCPVHCDSTQIMCYDEATMTDSCYPMDMPCPVHCDYATQVMCWDEATMTDSCYPMESGCPCPSNMQACPSDPMPGMPPMPPICHPMDMPCPVHCDS